MTHSTPTNTGRRSGASTTPPVSRTAVHVVINVNAGQFDPDDIKLRLRHQAVRTARDLEFHEISVNNQLTATAQQAALAAKASGGSVVVVGGDGSVSEVGRHCVNHQVPMGIIPTGTFNIFAREHRIPTDPQEAVESLFSARETAVSVGELNNTVFLVNASIGLYPKILRVREIHKRRFGRSRLVAIVSGVLTLMRHRRSYVFKATLDGSAPHVLRTRTIFVTNTRLQLEQLGIDPEPRPGSACLRALITEPYRNWSSARLLIKGLLRALHNQPELRQITLDTLTLEPRRQRRRMRVALDGEAATEEAPFRIGVHPQALRLLVPARSTTPTPRG